MSAVLAPSLRPCWAQEVSSELISLDTAGIPHQAVPGIPLPCLTLLMLFPSTSRSQTSGQAQHGSHSPHPPLTSVRPSGLSQHLYSRTEQHGRSGRHREGIHAEGPSPARPACQGALQTSPPDVPLLSRSRPRRKAGGAEAKRRASSAPSDSGQQRAHRHSCRGNRRTPVHLKCVHTDGSKT